MSTTIEYYNVARTQVWDITPITTNIEVNGSIDRYYRSAAVTLVERAGVPLNTGGRVRIYTDKKLIFDGKVFSYSNSSAQGVSLICHDNAYYLEKNVVNLIRFADGDGTTLADLFKSYCKRAGIKVGYVKPTTHKHKNINYLGESMQTVLQGLIGRERRGSGKRLYVMANADKLELRERGAMQGIVIDTDMASEVTATLDAQNIYTRIQTIGTKETTANGETTGVANITAIHSSNYKGPDSTSYQSGFRARLKASDRWDPIILNVANKNKVDPLLLKILVMMESSGNADSSNDLGAKGLTQIIASDVGVPVDSARLLEPEYNLESACRILLQDKLPIAKGLSRDASSVNMAHFWNGWKQSDGESDSAYSATFRTIYKGFGGDPDKLFTDTSISSANAQETMTPVSSGEKETFSGFATNKSLVAKFGNIENIVRIKAESATEAAREAQRLANQMREERTVVVRCKGHFAALTGRKVHFRDNDYASGTWYIKADTHVITSTGHEVTLTLDKYDQTPEPEVPEGPERETTATESDTGDLAPSRDHKFLIRPAEGRITQSFGPATYRNAKYSFHNGIDIANETGTPIRAAASGRVAQVGYSAGGYGNFIEIWHFPNGVGGDNPEKWITLYGHLSTTSVKTGDVVTQGQVIGKMGSTGFSTGSHLHFELHKTKRIYDAHQARNSVNPAIYF